MSTGKKYGIAKAFKIM